MSATAGIEASTENQHEEIDYQVVHKIVGRIRIRVPKLAVAPAYAIKLQQLVESLNFVTSVRLNLLADSMIVHYRASAISDDIQEHLSACIQQAGTVGGTVRSPSVQPALKLENDGVIIADNKLYASLNEISKKELPSQPESFPLTASAEAITPAVAEVAIPDLLLTPDEAVPITAITEEASIDLPEALPLTPEETVSPVALKEEPVSIPETLPLTSEETVLPAVMEEPVNLPELPLDAFVAVSSDVINEEQVIPDASLLTASTEVTASAVKTDPSPVKLRLNQNDLAERLGVATQALTHQRTKPKFNEWSKARDPEGRSWVYASATKSYYTDDRKARKFQQSDAAPNDKNGKAGEEL